MIVTFLIMALAAVMLAYTAKLVRTAWQAKQVGLRVEALALGAVTNFFDTLGIGSFAPSIAWMRMRKLVPDRLIPLTMLAGYIIPSLLQGLIFMILLGVKVDPLLVLGCVTTMIIGGYLSPGLAARAPIRVIQTIVGVALLLAAFFYTLGNLGLMPAGGMATSLPLGKALIAMGAHLIFGILLGFGVGNYAPTLALLSLMGMDPRLSFPIMASAAGFSGAAAAARCFRLIDLDYKFVLGLAAGAVPAVLVAAFIVKEMPLEALRWLVVVVVTYAGSTLLYSAVKGIEVVPDDVAKTAVTHQ